MRSQIAAAVALLALVFLPGCVALSIGGGEPTVAKEIRQLRRLKRWGTISDEEFQIGKLTLLEGRDQRIATEPETETRVASHSEPESE